MAYLFIVVIIIYRVRQAHEFALSFTFQMCVAYWKKTVTFLRLSSRVPHPKTTSLAPVFLSPNHGCPPTPLIQPPVPPHRSPDGTLLRHGMNAALEENQTIELLVERCHDMPPGVVWLAVTSRFGNQPLKTSQVGVST